jgi:hypothetical protein
MAYATWNSSDKGANITLSGGNLVAQHTAAATNHFARATLGKARGTWYWEITIGAATAAETLGVANATVATTALLGATAHSLAYRRDGAIRYNATTLSTVATYTTGDVIGVAMDCTTRSVAFYKNGVLVYTVASASVPNGALYPVAGSTTSSTGTFTANFGASAWVHTPPVGHVAMETSAGNVWWNPADKGSAITLRSDNREATNFGGAESDNVRLTIGKTSGKWYWEVIPGPTSDERIGIANGSQVIDATLGAHVLGESANSIAYRPTGLIRYNGVTLHTGATYTNGDVIGFALDKDANDLKIYKNNVLQYTVASANMPTGTIYPAVGSQSGAGNLFANFDSADWVYSAPVGYSELVDLLNFTMTGDLPMKAGLESTISGNNMITALGATVGVSATTEFTAALLHTMDAGAKVGISATINFTAATAYNITDDGMPNGGAVVGGAAIIQEAIQYVPTGGAVVGGSALVQDNIPIFTSGGAVVAGAAPVAFVSNTTPSGGVVVAGASPIIYRSQIVPVGGVVVAGDPRIVFRESYFLPTGGVVVGGDANVAFLRSGVVATPENPNGYPYEGLAVNLETFAPSRYVGMPATSITQFKGKTFMTNAAGIYEYGADTDAGVEIDASIQWPTTDYGVSRDKYMEAAYFGLRTTGAMRLKVIVDAAAPIYTLVQPTSTKMKGTRARLGWGLKGRYWGMRLDNIAGGDFELESAEFNPVAGQRHGA